MVDAMLWEFHDEFAFDEHGEDLALDLEAGRAEHSSLADREQAATSTRNSGSNSSSRDSSPIRFNSQMSPAEVLAVEIKQYLGEGRQTLVPRLVGQTAEAQMRKGRPEGRHWDEPSFVEEVERVQGREAAEAARAIMEWSRSNLARFTFSKGLTFGVFIPVLDYQGRSYKPFWVNTTKGVEFPFHSMHRMPPFEDEGKRVELVRRLNAIPGAQIPEERAVNSRPSVPLATFAPPEALAALLASLEWILVEIRGAPV